MKDVRDRDEDRERGDRERDERREGEPRAADAERKGMQYSDLTTNDLI
jgi:hypothetical protein